MSEDDTHPNPKYAKVENATDKVLAKIQASAWSGAIIGFILAAAVAFGLWVAL
jgi:hypothetical protein